MSNFLFNSVQIKKPKRNKFNLKNIHRFSAEFGKLYPTRCIEVLPGDKFKIDTTALVRMAPMVNPVMSHIDVDIRCFFVPSRILCDKWEDFITGGVNGTSSASLPYVVLSKGVNYYNDNAWGIGTLCDYLGLKFANTELVEKEAINILPFKAYTKIWNDWYRDELLDTEVNIHPEVSGYDSNFASYLPLRSRRFGKDYFTSARPTAQLGQPVNMPLSVNGTILADGAFALNTIRGGSEPLPTGDVLSSYFDDEDENFKWRDDDYEGEDNHGYYDGGLGLYDAAASLSIADLRRYFRIQSWNEKSIRTGNRYVENLLAHWGVRSSDARLQRSEYIGGTSAPVLISDIDSTGNVTGRQFGAIAGKGTSVSSPKTLKFYAEEHGYLICLLSILPKVGYCQGIDRMFTRMDKFDYAWPEFAHIGEQEIFNSELYNDGSMETFGYQSRYAEYKSAADMVSGEFRTTLTSWVQNRLFANRPTLSSQFVNVDDSLSQLNNIFAVVSGSNHFYCEVMNNIKVLRLLSKWSEPSIV